MPHLDRCLRITVEEIEENGRVRNVSSMPIDVEGEVLAA
jgi:hypothetical protein